MTNRMHTPASTPITAKTKETHQQLQKRPTNPQQNSCALHQKRQAAHHEKTAAKPKLTPAKTQL